MSKSRGGQLTNLLIIFVLLWLVFSGLCYFAFTNADKAMKSLKSETKKLKSAQRKLTETQERLEKISNLVGFHKSKKMGGSFRSDPDTIIFSLDTICADEAAPGTKNSLGLKLESQVIDKEGNIKQGKNFVKDELLNVDYVKTLINLEDVWKACATRVNSLQSKIESTREKLQDQQKQYEEAKQKTVAEINRMNKKIRDKRNNIDETRKSYARRLDKSEKQRSIAQDAKNKEKEKVSQLVRMSRIQNNRYKTEIENLDERIRELQAEAAGQTGIERLFQAQAKSKQVQESPDGEIIYVNDKNKTAYIDLGKPDGVLKGMTFQVFRYGKGGVKDYKGKIIIRHVEVNMSKVGIDQINNNLNPIAVGDKIINRVFDRNKVKYFAIAGKLSQKYSLEQVSRLVKNIGGRIEQQVTARTDIVVLAEGFKDDRLYKIAIERGIETMLEAEFLSYLGD